MRYGTPKCKIILIIQINIPPKKFPPVLRLLAVFARSAVEGRDVLAGVDVENLGEAVHATRGKDRAAVGPKSRFNRMYLAWNSILICDSFPTSERFATLSIRNTILNAGSFSNTIVFNRNADLGDMQATAPE